MTITWREMAARLAARLEHQTTAACGNTDGLPGSEWNHNPPTPDDCPFCADRDVYKQWVRKEAGMINGRRHRDTGFPR